MGISLRAAIMSLAGAIILGLLLGVPSFFQQREVSSREQHRERALYQLGCERREVVTWHQLKGYVTNPKRTWVCDQVEIDDQLASILADERLAGGTSEWRLFRGHNEERRRLDTRP